MARFNVGLRVYLARGQIVSVLLGDVEVLFGILASRLE
jgi:hypothetical protein